MELLDVRALTPMAMIVGFIRAEVVIVVYGFTDSPNQCQTRLNYYYFFYITTFDVITTFGFFGSPVAV